jgi:hypothetical protein
MSFTFVNGNGAGSGSDTASIVLTGATVNTGDLVAAYVLWNDATHALTYSFTDSSSTYTAGGRNTGVGSYSGANGAFFYKTASVATGNPTYTFTATGCGTIFFLVYVWRPTGTVTFDLDIATATSVSSSSVDSGALVTTGSNELIIGGMSCLNDATPVTAQAIGGTSATTLEANGAYGGSTLAFWYLEKTGTNNATATLNSAQAWIANAIGFINTDGGASQILHPASWM